MLHAKFARFVGVAPGTTTMSLNGAMMPYPTIADLRHNGLGVVFSEEGGGHTVTSAVGRGYTPGGQAVPLAVQRPTMPPLSFNYTTSSGMPLPPKSGVQFNGGGLGYITSAWWQTGRTDGDSVSGRINRPSNIPDGYMNTDRGIPPTNFGSVLGGALGYIAPMSAPYFKRTIQTEPSYPAPANPVFLPTQNAPNDFELSRVYGYTPVHSGWMYGGGMAGAAEDAVDLQRKQFTMQTVATVAIAAIAALSIYKFVKDR